jgi:hypothetical protein
MRVWKLAFATGLREAIVAVIAVLIASMASYLAECGFVVPPAEFVMNVLKLQLVAFAAVLLIVPVSTRMAIRRGNEVKPKRNRSRKVGRWL